MKGDETKYLLEIIIVIAVLVVLAIVVVLPSMNFAKGSGSQISFREFCLNWQVVGYPREGYPNKDGNVVIGKYPYSIQSECSGAGVPDVNACINLCRG